MPRTHLQCRLPAPPRGRRQLSCRAHHVRATRSAPDRSRSSTAAYVRRRRVRRAGSPLGRSPCQDARSLRHYAYQNKTGIDELLLQSSGWFSFAVAETDLTALAVRKARHGQRKISTASRFGRDIPGIVSAVKTFHDQNSMLLGGWVPPSVAADRPDDVCGSVPESGDGLATCRRRR